MNRRTWLAKALVGIGAVVMPWKVKAAAAKELDPLWWGAAQFLRDVADGKAIGRNYDLGNEVCWVTAGIIRNCQFRGGPHAGIVLDGGPIWFEGNRVTGVWMMARETKKESQP